MYITSKNSILEALSKNIVVAVYVVLPLSKREKEILKQTGLSNIKIKYLDKEKMVSVCGKYASICAEIREPDSFGIEALVKKSKDFVKNPLIFLLDGITDVHNFGAILRNAYFFGVSGIVISKDNSAPLNSKAYEISSGAAYHIPIITVSNLNRAVEYLKENYYWVYYASEKGETTLDSFAFDTPTAIILGNEHSGVRELVRQNSDGSIVIKAVSNFDSLNVSCAAAVISYAYSLKMQKN